MSSPEDPRPDEPELDAERPTTTSGGGCCGGMFAGAKNANRRDFMLIVGTGLNVVAGALMGVPILGYILSNFTARSPQKWLSLGSVEKFPQGTTRIASYTNPNSKDWDGKMAELPCWVRHRPEGGFQVFAINCTHLGCPVRWFDESKLFLCPCHGGAYYADGKQAAGPPPRGLYEYEHRLDGTDLMVNVGQIPTLSQDI